MTLWDLANDEFCFYVYYTQPPNILYFLHNAQFSEVNLQSLEVRLIVSVRKSVKLDNQQNLCSKLRESNLSANAMFSFTVIWPWSCCSSQTWRWLMIRNIIFFLTKQTKLGDQVAAVTSNHRENERQPNPPIHHKRENNTMTVTTVPVHIKYGNSHSLIMLRIRK